MGQTFWVANRMSEHIIHMLVDRCQNFTKSGGFGWVGLRSSRPILSCENGRVGVSAQILWPTDRTQYFGRTKSLSDSETGWSVIQFWLDKVNNWLFHFSHERTGREPRRWVVNRIIKP